MYSSADVGVNRSVVRGIRHKKFIVLFDGGVLRHRMRIQSNLHRIGTYVCEI